ncbi:MAG: hypothetical protein IMW98_06390 [Firmicutes bacterium]|nr:hypothetical protein [Bacillota bacterium]
MSRERPSPILVEIHEWVKARRAEAEEEAKKPRLDVAGILKSVATIVSPFISGWLGGKTS